MCADCCHIITGNRPSNQVAPVCNHTKSPLQSRPACKESYLPKPPLQSYINTELQSYIRQQKIIQKTIKNPHPQSLLVEHRLVHRYKWERKSWKRSTTLRKTNRTRSERNTTLKIKHHRERDSTWLQRASVEKCLSNLSQDHTTFKRRLLSKCACLCILKSTVHANCWDDDEDEWDI